jgi:TonB family protein
MNSKTFLTRQDLRRTILTADLSFVFFTLVGILSAVLLFVASPTPAQQATTGSPATAPRQQDAIPAATLSPATALSIPSYPDSPKGLEKLMKDMLKLDKGRDDKELAAYVESLALPSPDTWFRATFGDAAGAELAASYDRVRFELPMSFPDMLAQLRAKHFDEPQVVRFDDSCDPNATDAEYDALTWRRNAQPLYDVRFINQTQSAILHYFAYVDGAFRYIGNLRAKTTEANPHPINVPRIRVGGNVMMAEIVKQPHPVYPEAARQAGIEGTVIIHAIIGRNGNVCRLQVISGPPLLVQSALDAVRQWRYKPTLLKREPVEVDTTIQVIFNIR